MLTTTLLTSVPADPPDRPTVFIVVTARAVTGRTFVNGVEIPTYSGGDVGGILMHADGSTGWEHMSSGISWLARDLTTSFPDRRDALVDRYGEEFDIAVIEDWATAPEWLRTRNAAWAATTDTTQESASA